MWITLIKRIYAPLQCLKTSPDIHQGERLCGGLLPSARLVSEKNSSRQLGEQGSQPVNLRPLFVLLLGDLLDSDPSLRKCPPHRLPSGVDRHLLIGVCKVALDSPLRQVN